jgi:hypothetical protein
VPRIEAENFAKADSTVFEAPITSVFLAVAKIVDGNCKKKRSNSAKNMILVLTYWVA